MRTVAVRNASYVGRMFSLTDQLVHDRRQRLLTPPRTRWFRRRRQPADAAAPSVQLHVRPVVAEPLDGRLATVLAFERPVRLLVDEGLVEARRAVGE